MDSVRILWQNMPTSLLQTNIFKIKITHDLPLLAGGPVVGGPPFCTNACSITGALALNENLDFEY